jgi:hypothetical protein
MAEQEIEGLNIEICDSETNQVIDMVKEDIQEILLWLESNELIELLTPQACGWHTPQAIPGVNT